MAGYKDDFYIDKNIVGYTGKIDEYPTVYFERTEENDTISFGRITQRHHIRGNIGREVVQNRPASSYKRANLYVGTKRKKNEGDKEEYTTRLDLMKKLRTQRGMVIKL